MTDTRKWSALAAVLVVAIFAAGWFLLVSPKRGEAADLEARRGPGADQRQPRSRQISDAAGAAADLPAQQAQLAAIAQQIPDNPALPSLDP